MDIEKIKVNLTLCPFCYSLIKYEVQESNVKSNFDPITKYSVYFFECGNLVIGYLNLDICHFRLAIHNYMNNTYMEWSANNNQIIAEYNNTSDQLLIDSIINYCQSLKREELAYRIYQRLKTVTVFS